MKTLKLAEHFKALKIKTPSLQLVLGSGLSSAFNAKFSSDAWTEKGQVAFGDVEGLIAATAPGHKGVYRYFEHRKSKKTICFQVGRVHGYEGLHPRDVVKPVMIPLEEGTTKFLLTNAAGGLNPKFKVGSLMVITDHVNLTGTSPLYGPNPTRRDGQPHGPRFPDMTEVYSKAMRARLKGTLTAAAKKNKFNVVEGVYLGLLGPAYETPAEVRLFSGWGMSAVGMSTVWESMSLRHGGAQVVGLSFISNLGTGLSKTPLAHEEVEREAGKIASKLVNSLFDYAEKEILV